MENPFEHLRLQREQSERERQRQGEARRETQRRDEQRRRTQVAAAETCDGLVVRLLTQLQQAAYPASRVRSHAGARDSLRDHLRGQAAWSVGKTDAYWATDSVCEQAWYPEVVVRLQFDEQDEPRSFSCGRVPGCCVRTWYGRKFVDRHVQCDLSERGLVKALCSLYPANELDWPRWRGYPEVAPSRSGLSAESAVRQ